MLCVSIHLTLTAAKLMTFVFMLQFGTFAKFYGGTPTNVARYFTGFPALRQSKSKGHLLFAQSLPLYPLLAATVYYVVCTGPAL